MQPPTPPQFGTCDRRFDRVREAFWANFTERGELGAAVCVYAGATKVVDIWGGFFDTERSRPWAQDTITNVMSITKGSLALTVHALVEEQKLDYDEPVASYWPEFAQAGKERITVGQLVSHHAGLPYADLAPEGSFWDWDVMARALAAQQPEWPAGTQGAYHSCTYWHLLGELVRRTTGESYRLTFARRFATPLELDYVIGMNETDIGRVSPLVPNEKNDTFSSMANPQSNLARAWRVARGIGPNDARRARSQAGGHTNARSLARLYAALANGGRLGDRVLLAGESVDRLRAEQWDQRCGLTGRAYRMAMGLFLNSGASVALGPNRNAFGHHGAGGPVAFADPDVGIAFSYTMNALCAGGGLGERCEALIEATYRSLAS